MLCVIITEQYEISFWRRSVRALPLQSAATATAPSKVKELQRAVVEQLISEATAVSTEGLSAARGLARLQDIDQELNDAEKNANAMYATFEKGMEVYRRLRGLGARFEEYNEENMESFWPSLLTWLR